jgi:hypothetical protein
MIKGHFTLHGLTTFFTLLAWMTETNSQMVRFRLEFTSIAWFKRKICNVPITIHPLTSQTQMWVQQYCRRVRNATRRSPAVSHIFTEQNTVSVDRKRYVQGPRYNGVSVLVLFVAYNAPHIATILLGYGNKIYVTFRNAKMDTLSLKRLM